MHAIDAHEAGYFLEGAATPTRFSLAAWFLGLAQRLEDDRRMRDTRSKSSNRHAQQSFEKTER